MNEQHEHYTFIEADRHYRIIHWNKDGAADAQFDVANRWEAEKSCEYLNLQIAQLAEALSQRQAAVEERDMARLGRKQAEAKYDEYERAVVAGQAEDQAAYETARAREKAAVEEAERLRGELAGWLVSACANCDLSIAQIEPGNWLHIYGPMIGRALCNQLHGAESDRAVPDARYHARVAARLASQPPAEAEGAQPSVV